jgi:hypothetical protein
MHAVTLLNGTIYLGGWFDTMNGATRHNLAIIERFGTVVSWAPNANNEVQALAASGSTVYAGGGFSFIGGNRESCLGGHRDSVHAPGSSECQPDRV